jgi:hypothetical protein
LEVEDPARVDLAVPDEVDELGQEAAHRGRPSVNVRKAPEQVHPVQCDAVSDADEADVAAGARGVDGLHHRLLRADGLDHGVRAEPVREFVDGGHAGVAALLDDVGRTVLASQALARFVAAHGDDPLRAELLGSDSYLDWDRIARDVVATLRSAAGRNPYDRELTDLVGELSTRSDEFRVRWAAHNVRFHRTGTKRIHHPVVGDLELSYETMELSADAGLTVAIFTAEPGSASQQALDLLASWTATPAPAAT